MKKVIFILAINLIFTQYLVGQRPTDKIKVLIVDGFSNHNWKQTTSLVKTILNNTNLFDIKVSTAPDDPQSPDWKKWLPEFHKYDVVIQNTNNIHKKMLKWPTLVEKDLENYVKSGGGLYILHSANNAFDHWEAYNDMIGLGWRKAHQGIAIQIGYDQKIIEIPINEGKSTYHGAREDEVIYLLKSHPINKGFPTAWKTPNMELYKYPRGSAKNLTVLSYALDETTDMRWPVEWVVNYGKGRVYNSSLGHLWKDQTYPLAYQCVGFQTTLIRATEWLAKGKVTYKIPEDFPTESKMILREKL